MREGKNFTYNMKKGEKGKGKGKRDDFMEVKLFPNGVCEVFEESVKDENTHVNEHGLGIYTESLSTVQLHYIILS